MKIYQLIENLKTFNPNLDVMVGRLDHTYATPRKVADEISSVSWTAVDPKLGEPQTVIIEVKE